MEKPKMVTVEALEAHTAFGKSYEVGDTYEIDEQNVESLRVQGKAVRADRVAVAKKATKAAEESAKVAKTRSTKVEPMTTTSKSGKALAKPKARK